MTPFHELHRPGRPFLLVNVSDAGTARVAAALGAKAIATSSAAHAFTLGRHDGGTTLDEALEHAAALAAATPLPLAIDFEDGFAATPEGVAANVRRAAGTGAAGVSVEDWRRDGAGAYGAAEAAERVAAAAEAARAAGLHLVARADGVMHGAYGVPEAVRRLRAFAEAGADCLYAPALPDAAALAEVVALGRPVNVLAAGPWLEWDMARFAAAGVARVSLGSALARRLQRTLLDALGPALAEGRLAPLEAPGTAAAIDAMLAPPEAAP